MTPRVPCPLCGKLTVVSGAREHAGSRPCLARMRERPGGAPADAAHGADVLAAALGFTHALDVAVRDAVRRQADADRTL